MKIIIARGQLWTCGMQLGRVKNSEMWNYRPCNTINYFWKCLGEQFTCLRNDFEQVIFLCSWIKNLILNDYFMEYFPVLNKITICNVSFLDMVKIIIYSRNVQWQLLCPKPHIIFWHPTNKQNNFYSILFIYILCSLTMYL